MLKAQTPYMLRNDGKIFECKPMHPYILYSVNDKLRTNLFDLIVNNSQVLDWFYKNTKQDWVRNKIIECLQYLANAFYNESEIDLFFNLGISANDLQPFLDKYRIKPQQLSICINQNYIQTCEALFQDLNDKCNQEFLRFRTSGMFYGGSGNGIYFRISSVSFNWFNLIWEIVYNHRDWLTDVTIVADEQSSKKENFLYYNLNGPVNKMSVDKFIWLKGNPIVEDFISDIDQMILNNQGSLLETFGDYGPFHNHRKFLAYKSEYQRKWFV